MYSVEVKLRVRYGETDKMGYVYHGNYPQYYEVARVEWMRSLGMSYKEVEDDGIIMPVIDMRLKYLAPAFYDEELVIRASVREMPATRILFHYEVFNQVGKLINEGENTLVFVNAETRRPLRLPERMKSKLLPYFN